MGVEDLTNSETGIGGLSGARSGPPVLVKTVKTVNNVSKR